MAAKSDPIASPGVFDCAETLQAGVVLTRVIGVSAVFGGADVLARLWNLGCFLPSSPTASHLIYLLLALSGTFAFQPLFHYLNKIQNFNYKQCIIF